MALPDIVAALSGECESMRACEYDFFVGNRKRARAGEVTEDDGQRRDRGHCRGHNHVLHSCSVTNANAVRGLSYSGAFVTVTHSVRSYVHVRVAH